MLVNVAYVLDGRDRENDIILYCKQAIKYELEENSKSKNVGWMYNMISDAYFSIGDYQKSLKNINLAIENISSESIFYQRRANCYLKLGNKDEAEKDFNSCVNNSASLYIKINNLLQRAAFYQEDINLPMKSIFDFTEIINILNLDNSDDFINTDDKEIFYILHSKQDHQYYLA